MLENIFAGGQQTRLSSLKNRFYTAIPMIKQDIKSALKNKGMYLLDPGFGQWLQRWGRAFDCSPFHCCAIHGIQSCIQLGYAADRCGIISAVIWWLFARQMSAKTLQGGAPGLRYWAFRSS